MIRRFFAGFLIFLFVLVAIVSFSLQGIARTFINPEFYTGEVTDGVYGFFVDVTTEGIYQKDSIFQKYFQKDELHQAIEDSFQKENFSKIMEDFAAQLQQFTDNSRKDFALNLQPFRQGLVNAMSQLATRLFQKIPPCRVGDNPQVNEDSIPTCVPVNVDFESISAPLAKQFEKSVYGALPERIQVDFSQGNEQRNAPIVQIIIQTQQAKLILTIVMVVLLGLIALLVFKPFASILFFEGAAFFISGVVGFLVSLGLGVFPRLLFENMRTTGDDIFSSAANIERFKQLVEYFFGFFTFEVQKMSLVFLNIGIVIFVVAYLLRKHHLKTVTEM